MSPVQGPNGISIVVKVNLTLEEEAFLKKTVNTFWGSSKSCSVKTSNVLALHCPGWSRVSMETTHCLFIWCVFFAVVWRVPQENLNFPQFYPDVKLYLCRGNLVNVITPLSLRLAAICEKASITLWVSWCPCTVHEHQILLGQSSQLVTPGFSV